MIDKEKAKMNMKKQWIKFGVVTALYLLFLLWVKSWLGLIVVPFIFDNYITKKIRWTWWKDAEGPVRFIMSWVDALVFALVAVYSVLNGAMLSSVFVVYTMTSIAKVFFITAGTFGAMAFYGYTTKKDLTSLGKILFMALIGLIIATVVNMFLKSSGFDYILSYAGVAIFVGLTAWDSQKIKQMLQTQYDMSEGAQKLALIGALTLYLDFINLFLYLLRIFGGSNKE